ncbi:xylose isomerase-like TIM barrel [Nitrobacter winogradskyi Nb-255]|uniref:Xylose isomerase-like TIM barrel n=2 Tax=Nitrobacter winogradskyi TaxID=913 RepID=Q3SQ89_NITWN|nr:xylose isomerase-like TIM barrel [Nitrobacter winogradskyi Nb-255]
MSVGGTMMKLSVCTITFRHHLISIWDIAVWARRSGFDGIELWGAHARGLARTHPHYGADWLGDLGLSVSMLSDYLPTDGDPAIVRERTQRLCRMAQHWSAPKIRTFVGDRPSVEVPEDKRKVMTSRVRDMAAIAYDHGIRLLVETHPNTLADSLASTQRLLAEVDHPGLGINFDALHVWEGGDDLVSAHRALAPYIGHYHLKNVRSRGELNVFAPGNVYAAAGCREGMVPLFEGAMSLDAFLSAALVMSDADASLEWFGEDCFETLIRDRVALLAHIGALMQRAVPREAIVEGRSI